MNRRNFLKSGSLLLLTSLLEQQLSQTRSQTDADPETPNVLILVFDTLSAAHMSLHGYRRNTTPNIERFARRATVFHSHYAGGNFTTPGTASLLTGTYPWTHRAFNHTGTVADAYHQRNLFSAFTQKPYYQVAYTHNLLAQVLLNNCGEALDLHVPPHSFSLVAGEIGERLFPRDPDIATRGLDDLTLRHNDLPGSLFLSLGNRVRTRFLKTRSLQPYRAQFPRGVPELFKMTFVLEEIIDGIMSVLQQTPQPFLGYFHLLPPHEPYRPHRDFVGIFDDGWAMPPKDDGPFPGRFQTKRLQQWHREYDEFIAYTDAHFGRLLDFLERSGRLDDTIVVFTSDHGQLFERGIHGHITQTLYDPVIRVPLLISQPGQNSRVDIHTPTSCVDLIPTLLHLTNQPAVDWTEGQVLPLNGEPASSEERPVFALEAKRNPKHAPLNRATATLVRGQYKLVGYFGYGQNGSERYELFDLANDPEERDDLYATRSSLAAELRETLRRKVNI
ncbi:MAG: sulfatase [Chloroflexota bacterium]